MLPLRLQALSGVVLIAALCSATAAPRGSEAGPAAYGGAVVAGGTSDTAALLASLEMFGLEGLPDLPAAVVGNTVTAMGTVLYSCGGNTAEGDSDQCYTLDTSSASPQWSASITLPVTMVYHSAVAVGTHIWFIFYDSTYDLDTETGNFETYKNPFDPTTGHCAVATSTRSYVIGVGANQSQIWVNAEDGSPASWTMVQVMNEGRGTPGCLLMDNKIYITGGAHNGTEKTSDVLDLITFELSSTGDLVAGRNAHGMFVLDGNPAVVGGFDTNLGNPISSVETYDTSTQTWNTDSRVLSEARCLFGLGQLVQV